jgi:molecular chaperone DnaJ
MSELNHYHTLEVQQGASQEEIKQSYRRLAKLFHPDSNKQIGDLLCSSASYRDKIVQINAAYEVLGDPQRREVYDSQLRSHIFNIPSHRYQSSRHARQSEDSRYSQWIAEVYKPIVRAISPIFNRLEEEIEELSADPFDEELMAIFQEYVEDCRYLVDKAQKIFTSQPNPAKLAKIAANIYYCLDRLNDGINELEFFTLNYDDRYLHSGQEIFQIARQLCQEARENIKFCL